MKTQKCEKCPPGTYSLGDGLRLDSFSKLPKDMLIDNRFQYDMGGMVFGEEDVANCSG